VAISVIPIFRRLTIDVGQTRFAEHRLQMPAAAAVTHWNRTLVAPPLATPLG
jgi:hypothetical protein